MITVSEALDFYRNDRIKDVSDPKRLDVIIAHLRRHLGGIKLHDVDVLICRGYSEARRGYSTILGTDTTEIADSTIARELGLLRTASNYCLKWKKIAADRAPTFELPADLPKGVTWLLNDELNRLYAAAHDYEEKMYNFIRLLYTTASRRGAIECLEWSQVDFTRKVIYLDKPNAKKTKKRRPTVPMGESYDMLLDMHKYRRNIYVFDSPRERYRAFMRIAVMAGLDNLPERDGRPCGRISPHILRHTRATHLLENGMPLYSVARLLGDNPTTVERVYAHASISKLESELEKYSC